MTMKKIQKIALLPFKYAGYVLAIFTGASSFVANPVLGSKMLNRMGLHVVRYTLAHALAHFRWLFLAWKMPSDLRRRFHRDGYVVIEDFLDQDAFAALRLETETVEGEARELSQGDARTQRILLDDQVLAGHPALTGFKGDKKFQHYLDYAGSFSYPALLYLQRIRNGITKGNQGAVAKDPQKNIHSDTFHPTMKAWYFLDDVDRADGPFTYVAGSHQLTWKRLKWEYKKSITAVDQPDGYSEKGSMRATLDDLGEMEFGHPQGLPLKANSLVIANTHGFHCRGQAEGRRGRFELWAMTRLPPFWPLPIMALKMIRPLQEALITRHWRRLDKKNAARGVPSTWHVINPKKVTKKDVSDQD